MRLMTIWTMRRMTLRERLARSGEVAVTVLAHYLPRRLAYASFIDSGVRLTADNEVVTEVRYTDLLQRAHAEGWSRG